MSDETADIEIEIEIEPSDEETDVDDFEDGELVFFIAEVDEDQVTDLFDDD